MTDNLTRTEPASRLATLGSVLANWRDWNLPVKLAAVILVPVIFAIVLGAMQIADQVDRASSYRRVDRLVVVNEELRSLVSALQRERTTGAVLLAARASDLDTELRQERGAVDSARDGFTRATGRVTLDEEITAARYADVRTWLGELRGVREQVSGALIDASTALGRYTEIIDALLRFDRALSAEAIDPGLVAASSALHDLEAIGEQVQFQHTLIGVGIVRGGLVGTDLAALRTSLARFEDSTIDFHAVAGTRHTQAFDRIVDEQVVAGRTNLVGTIAASPPGTRIPANVQDWNAASDAAASGIASVADVLGKQLRDRSAALQDEASDGAGLAAVILLVALVVAIGVMFVVGRHLLSSLSALRRTALDVAEQRLPAAVARIRDRGEDADSITLEPVPVTSLDEVGQVARAFDAVQRQALRLATEQAGLRAQYSSVFVNLSRRSQGLVQRQLHLLERLERDEEDADQLATLFQLDHLATRMRRNNENLMVLSGSDVGRRNQRPATLADLLRAAVSEIEQYQRVVMLPPPSVLVVGYAVGDLVRLTAELLDNATAFSAPDTNVTIASHSFEDGSLCVAVLDEGIGMNQTELDEANAKLADSGSIDVSTSRRMGLFVIGRLAGRHGIEVRLNGGHDVTGVRATVTVPADLVTTPVSDRPAPVAPPSVPRAGAPSSGLVPFSPSVNGRGDAVNGSHGTNGTTHGSANGTNGGANGGGANGVKPNPLPRRTRPTNGSDSGSDSGSDIAKRLGGEPDDAPQRRAEPPTPDAPPSTGADAKVAADPATTSGADARPGPDADSVTNSATDPVPGAVTDSANGAMPGSAPGAATGSATDPESGSVTSSATDPVSGADARAETAADAPVADHTVSSTDSTTGASTDPGTDAVSGTDTRADAPATDAPATDAPATAPDRERMPLPRRSPGGLPGQHPYDLARPRTPFAPTGGPVSPADGLFTSPGQPGPGETRPPAGAPRAPQSQPRRSPAGGPRPPQQRPGSLFDPAARQGASRWTPRGPGTPVDPRALEETTPIFDEMVSAWFRTVTDPPAEQPAGEPEPQPRQQPQQQSRQQPQQQPRQPSQDESWRFSADAGFHAAHVVSRAEPSDFTDTGLPRRNPRQNLVPGSVARSAPAGPPRHGKTAEDVRDRLSNYRYGVRRARDHQEGTRQDATPDLTGAGWRFAADVGWRAANAVSTSTPVDFTSGGLPRRTPQDNLVPGSVMPGSVMPGSVMPGVTPGGGADGPPRMDRAAELRGRLGSFQTGLSRGRRSLAERAAANGIPENKQQQESE